MRVVIGLDWGCFTVGLRAEVDQRGLSPSVLVQAFGVRGKEFSSMVANRKQAKLARNPVHRFLAALRWPWGRLPQGRDMIWNSRAASGELRVRLRPRTGPVLEQLEPRIMLSAVTSGFSYDLINSNSNMAATVVSLTPGTPVTQTTQNAQATPSQEWKVENVGGSNFEIINNSTGLALGVTGGSTTAGATVDEETYSGATSQQWNFTTITGGGYNITNVNSGMVLDVVGSSTASGIGLEQNTAASGTTSQVWVLNALPPGWSDQDIGAPANAGSADFNGTIWTVNGGGGDIWNASDQFNFASQSFTGDGTIIAQITSQADTASWAKAGVMIRDSSSPSAAFAYVQLDPGDGARFEWRSVQGGICSVVQASGAVIGSPVWVKLTRAGERFSAFYSTNGTAWTQLGGTESITLSNATNLAGLAVTAENGPLATATFANVSVTSAPIWNAATLSANYTVASGTVLDIANSLTFTNGAALTVDAGAMVNFVNGTSITQTVGGSGSIVLQGASGGYAPAQVVVDGAAAGSSVTFANGVNIQGQSELAVLDVVAGNTLSFNDTISQLTLNVESGGFLQTDGPGTVGTLATVTLGASPTLLSQSDVDITGGLGLLNGATLTVDAGSTVNFVDGTGNSQSVYGVGSIVLQAASGNYAAGQLNVDGATAGSTLTFNVNNNLVGAGVANVAAGNTLVLDNTVQQTTLTAASGGEIQLTAAALEGVVLSGAVNVTGGTSYFTDYHNWSTGLEIIGTSNANITIAGGADLSLNGMYWSSIASTWTNTGAININSGGTLNLGGTFDPGNIGTINNSGGTIDFGGVLNNTGGNVSAALLNSWTMDWGGIFGGTVGASGDTVIDGNSLHLDGVTLAANISVASGATLWIGGGLTMQAGATATIASGGGLVFFGGGTTAQSISGSGQINLVSGSTVDIYYGATTLGAGIIFAGAGTIVDQYNSGLLVNQGTIDANVSGQTLTITAPFQNDGTLTTANGGNLAITGTSFTLDSDGSLTDNTGSTVTLGAASIPWINSGTINISGGTLDIGGLVTTADLGLANWHYTAGQVELTGTIDNTGVPLTLNGVTSLIPGGLELTNGQPLEAASAFENTPINVASNFTSNFSFQLANANANANADGFTFTIQGQGTSALGGDGGALGYTGISSSVAVKFDLYQNPGDPSNNSTGIFYNGYQPIGGTSLNSADINLHSGDVINVQVSYVASSNTLTVTETDTVTNTSLTQTYNVNIANTVGMLGWAGFTAGSGYLTATQQILSWSINGSAVNLANTANTSADVLNLSPTTTGSLLLDGGTIKGGTISATGGVGLEVIPTAPAPIPLADSGFETPVLALGTYQREPSGTGWNFPNYYTGIAANGSAYTSANPSAPQGNQVGYIEYYGQISQSVNFTTAGTYSLSLLAAQRGNVNPAAQTLEVQIDGQTVYTFIPQGTSYQQYTTPAFTVSAGAHTITIVGLDNAGGDNTTLIDSVVINPATAALDGVTLSSNLTIQSGAGLRITGALTLENGATITTATGGSLTLDAVILNSNLTVVAGETLDVADGLTLGSGVTITVDACGTLNFVDGTSNTQTVSGSGSIVLVAASGSYAAGQINAAGTNAGSAVTLSSGVAISGPGAINAASGNTIYFAGTVQGATVSASSGGCLFSTQPWQSPSTFDGVTLASNLQIHSSDELDISDGITLKNNAVISTAGYGDLHFVNGSNSAQTVGGTGTIQLYTSGLLDAPGIGAWQSGSVVTIGSGITISGAGYFSGNTTSMFVNDGTIIAPSVGGALQIGEMSFQNNGTIEVATDGTLTTGLSNFTNEAAGLISVATGGTLNLNTNSAPWPGNWTNSGTITLASGGTLNLGGQFTTAGIGTINYNGGIVDLSGKLNNAGGILAATDLNNWTMAGGTIDGGTVGASGSTINLTGSSVTLDATTVDSSLVVGAGTTLNVADGLTLGSGVTITVDAGGSLNFVDGTSNTQTVSGSGSIVLAAASGSYAAGQINAAGTNAGSAVTLSSGVAISGPGAINAASGNTIYFAGTVQGATVSASSGGYLRVDASPLFDGVTVAGNMLFGWGSNLNVTDGLTLANNATLYVNGGYSNITFQNGSGTSQTLSGNGTIEMAGAVPAAFNFFWDYYSGNTLTIDPGITITGTGVIEFQTTTNIINEGKIIASGTPGYSLSLSYGNFQNDGTISAATGNTLIENASTFVNEVGGAMNVASGSTMNITTGVAKWSTVWTNSGTITVASGGTLYLGGQFTTAGIGTISDNGGTIDFSGKLNNANGILLASTLNTWTMDGGTIDGGTVGANGSTINLTGSSVTLDATTVDSNLVVGARTTLSIADGLTLGSGVTITVDAGGSLNFVDGTSDAQTINGSGSIILSAASGSLAAGQINANGAGAGSQVTFANGVNITGSGTGSTESGVTAAGGNTIIFDDTVTNATLSSGSGGILQTGGTTAIPTVFAGDTLDSNLTLNVNSVLNVTGGLNEAAGVVINQDSNAYLDLLAGATLGQTALQPWAGDGMVTAQIAGFTGTNPRLSGGVAFMDSNQAGAAFASTTVSAGGVITFQWQAAANGPVSMATVDGALSSEWVRLIHWGSTVTAFYSADGLNWTQIGTSQTVNFVDSTNLAGLVVSDVGGSPNDSVHIAGQSVTAPIPTSLLPPTVLTSATASSSPVTGTSINLSVSGQTDDGQGANTLIYTWSLLGTPPASVTFNANGTNAASATTATFTAAGNYEFQATITDAEGVSVASDVNVVVSQTLSNISVTPITGSVVVNGTLQFTARALDQFGLAMASQPTITWNLDHGTGTVTSGGLYAAPTNSGSATITAIGDNVTGNATVNIVDNPPAALSASTITYDSAVLSWQPVSDPNLLGYAIEQSTGGTSFLEVGAVLPGDTSFKVANLLSATAYTFYVEAVGPGGNSAVSNAVAVTTSPAPVPPVPTSVLASASGDNAVAVSWSDSGSNISGFDIQEAVGGGAYVPVATVSATTTTYTVGALSADTNYSFIVAAYNSFGVSAYSAPAMATTAAAAPSPIALQAHQYSAYEGEQLSVAAGSGLLSGATGPSGATLTAALIGSPENGSISVNSDGSFTYYAGNTTGPDSFSYSVSDGQGDVVTGIADLTVLSTGMLQIQNQTYYAAHDSTLSVTDPAQGVLAGAVDPNGLTLTATAVTLPANGALTLNPDGTFVYTPKPGYVGTDSFIYQASDGTNSYTAWANFVVTNAAPVVQNVSYSVAAGQTLNVSALEGLLAAASDADGDVLTVVPVDSGTSHNGAIMIQGSGAFTYTPSNNFTGSDSVQFGVTDGASTSYATLTLNVTAGIPAAADLTYTLAEGTVLNIGAGDGLLTAASDSANSPLVVDRGSTVTTWTGHGSVTINSDGSFIYTPDQGYFGSDSFTYYVSNGVEQSNTATVTLDIAGQTIVAPVENYVVSPGGTLTIAAASGLLAGIENPVPGTTLTAQTVGYPMDGILTLNSDGSFTYAPHSGFAGTDQFSYNVTDGSLTSNTATVLISVVAASPIGQAVNYSVEHNQTLVVNAADGVLASDASPSGGTLTAQLVSGPAHGWLALNSDGSFTYIPNNGYSGTDNFTYSASDGATTSAPILVEISVQDSPPQATGQTYSVYENSTLIASPGILASATDPDGDPLTATLLQTTTSGALSLNSDGTFTYTPTTGYTGTDAFTYSVSDGNSSVMATATINVLPITLPPVTSAPTYTTDEGQTLKVTADGLLTYATDPQNLPMTVNLVSGTTSGSLSFNRDGTFTYTPTPGYTGTDSFVYTVSDGLNASAPTTASISVVSQPPTAANTSVSIAQNGTLSVPSGTGLLSLATDPGGYTLSANLLYAPSHGALTLNTNGSYTYIPQAGYTGSDSFMYDISSAAGTSNAATVSITVSSQTVITNPLTYQTGLNQNLIAGAALGVLRDDWTTDGSTLTAVLDSTPSSGSVALNSDGSFTYSPATGFVGTTSFTYQADSSTGVDSGPVTVTINVVNAVPVAANLFYSVTHGQTLTISAQQGLIGTAFDIDGYPLTVASAGGINTGNGSVSLSANGSFVYTPNAGFVGTDTFNYAVSDGTSTSTSATVTITVTNSAPVGVTQTYQLLHDQTLSGNVMSGATDADGDPLTAKVYNTVQHGSLSLNSNGTFAYTPNAGYVGVDSFSYVLNDGAQNSQPATVSINVYNELPGLTSQAYTMDIATSGTLTGNLFTGVSDPDGDSITASLSNGSNNYVISSMSTAHGSVSITAGGQFTYTPNANYQGSDGFSYTALDSAGAATPATVAINVTNSLPSSVNEFFTTNGTNTANGNVLTLPAQNSGSTLPLTASLFSAYGYFGPPPGYGGYSSSPQPETTTAGGTVTLSSDGGFTYTSPTNFVGTDSFSYVLSSGAATSVPAVVTIDVNPTPPQTVNAEFTGTPGTNITGNVFANAPTGQSLTVVSVNGTQVSGSPTMTLPDGSLQIGSSGAFTFTPNAGFSGDETFNYVAENQYLQSQATNVSLDYAGGAMQATPATGSTQEGTALTGNILNNVSTVGTQSQLTVASVNGVVVGNSTTINMADGVLTVSSSGSFSYQPNSGSYGTDSFNYSVSNGQAQISGIYTINVSAALPTGSALAFTATENQPLTITAASLLAGVTDSNAGAGTLVANMAATPLDGSLSWSGSSWVYTPRNNFSGKDEFTYTVTDALGFTSAPILATVTVNPGEVTTAAAINAATLENQSTTINLANYINNLPWLAAGGSGLTVKITSNPGYGDASTAGTSITYTPWMDEYTGSDSSSVGADKIGYTLSDGKGDSVSGTVFVTVEHQDSQPWLSDVALNTTENSTGSYGLGNLLDTNGYPIWAANVRITSQPTSGAVWVSGDTLYYKPNYDFSGSDSFGYQVYGPNWLSSTGTATVKVASTPQPGAFQTPAGPESPYNGTPPGDSLNDHPDNNQSSFSLPGGGLIQFVTGSDIISVSASASYASGTNQPMVSVSINGDSVGVSVSGYAQNASASVSDTPLAGGYPGVKLSFTGSAANVSLYSAGTIASYHAAGNLTVNSGGYMPAMTAAGTLWAYSGGSMGNMTAGAGAYISATGSVGAVVAATSDEIWALDGAIGSINLSGNLGTTTSWNYQSITASGNIGNVTIGGQMLGDIETLGDMTGALGVTGNIAGSITVSGNISGGISSKGNITGTISVGGNITSAVSAAGYINTISGSGGMAGSGSISSGSTITQINVQGNLDGSITAPGGITVGINAGGSINATIDTKAANIGSINAAGDIAGTITAGSTQLIKAAGGDISANMTLAGTIGELSPSTQGGLIAGGDISGTIHVASINQVNAGRDISGKVTISGAIQTQIWVGRDITKAATLSVQQASSIGVGRNFDGTFSTQSNINWIDVGNTIGGTLSITGSVIGDIAVGSGIGAYFFPSGQINGAHILISGNLVELVAAQPIVGAINFMIRDVRMGRKDINEVEYVDWSR